jgi:hypothetical protein
LDLLEAYTTQPPSPLLLEAFSAADCDHSQFPRLFVSR